MLHKANLHRYAVTAFPVDLWWVKMWWTRPKILTELHLWMSSMARNISQLHVHYISFLDPWWGDALMMMADSNLALAFQFLEIYKLRNASSWCARLPYKDWASHDNTLLPKMATSLWTNPWSSLTESWIEIATVLLFLVTKQFNGKHPHFQLEKAKLL